MKVLKLQTADGKIYKVNVKIVAMFTSLKTRLEALYPKKKLKKIKKVVPLHNVNARILLKIIEWANYHRKDPDLDKIGSDDLSEWDKNFLKLDRDTLHEIMTAAEDLGLKGLVDCITLTVANMMKGSSAAEILAAFGI